VSASRFIKPFVFFKTGNGYQWTGPENPENPENLVQPRKSEETKMTPLDGWIDRQTDRWIDKRLTDGRIEYGGPS